MARPRKKLNDEQLKQLEKLAGVLNVEQLADFFGMARKTFFDLMNRDKHVSTLYKKGRAKMAAGIAGNLAQAALQGDAVRQMFYLKTQCGWKETKEVDVKSSDGSMSPNPDEVLKRIEAKHEQE